MGKAACKIILRLKRDEYKSQAVACQADRHQDILKVSFYKSGNDFIWRLTGVSAFRYHVVQETKIQMIRTILKGKQYVKS